MSAARDMESILHVLIFNGVVITLRAIAAHLSNHVLFSGKCSVPDEATEERLLTTQNHTIANRL